jgi:hypothetical protein
VTNILSRRRNAQYVEGQWCPPDLQNIVLKTDTGSIEEMPNEERRLSLNN